MDVEPSSSRTEPVSDNSSKTTRRPTRRRKTKTRRPDATEADSTSREVETPPNKPAVPPAADRTSEAAGRTADKSSKEADQDQPSSSSARRRSPHRRGRRRGRGTGTTSKPETADRVEEDAAPESAATGGDDSATTPVSSAAPEASPAGSDATASGRTKPPSRRSQGRRRRPAAEKAAEPAPEQAPAVAEPTPSTDDGRAGDSSTGEDAEKAGTTRPPRRRRRSTKARRPAPERQEAKDDTERDDHVEEVGGEPSTEDTPPAKDESVGRRTRSTRRPAKTGRDMIINVSAGEECRVAILHEQRLEELHIERQSAESHVGNIYKGRVTNVEPSIQAAFVDFGLAKNGFLHISDVQPRYFPEGQNEPENVGKKVPRRDRPPIHRCFRRGQEVIVQITKEGVGTKGPTLTTYLSIPGRYLVMMPGMSRLGVSRKIEDEEARHKMRSVLNELSLIDDMGFILRTAGLDRTKRELQRDLNYLKRLWKSVERRIRNTRAPAELYQESDLVIRTIRDLSTSDFDRIIIDHEATAEKAREFLQIAVPRARDIIELYTGPEPLFHLYGVEAEIEQINSRKVPLQSGGSIVIESTEAMVTIDVNSGKFRALDDAEETAFQINIEAATEIARQLRLRDLGGLVVCDFIDMRLDRHKRAVERALRDSLKKHKERARLLRMSQFGLIEMTRQRQRPSIKRSIYADCPHCQGSGLTKTVETMVLEVIRVLQLAAHKEDVSMITLTVAPEVATAVLNQRRAALHQMEQDSSTTIAVKADPALGLDKFAHEFRDARGRIIAVDMP
ncbi:MAG: Rne/Rng family ribonuclease [bacterium]|nr:Rne/Rng family ribonuclease [bacterium]